jgi:hypothetical protein
MYKKAKNIFLLAIVVSSAITSLFVFPNTAHAATPALFISPDVSNDAIASADRVSLALCLTIYSDNNDLQEGGGSEATSTQIANGDWFYDSEEPQVRAGYLVDPDNGQVQCRNLFEGHDVASSLGFDSNVDMACAIGMKRTNNSNCIDGSGNFTATGVTKNKIYAAVDSQRANITGGKGFNDAQYYVMAANTYIMACGGAPVVNLADANNDQKNNNDYDRVSVVDFTGGLTTVLYKKDNNSGKAFRNDEGDFHFINENCSWMAKEMNQTAKAYQTWVKAHQPGKNGMPGTCEEAYGKSGNELKACQDGFANKGKAKYCETKYPTMPTYSPEALACIYGQDKATAAAGTTAAPEQPGAEEPKGKSSCVVEGIGWIVCPVLKFMSQIVDAAYGFVASLLTVQPLLTTGDSAGVFNAWSVMRNFANVAFVVAFLLIIFSQLTSVGISNYGIKKMLPRLIVAAILVNVSYWICAIAVDLSNIIGSSINDVLKGIGNNSIVAGPNAKDFGATGNNWTGIVGFILAGGIATAAALYVGLSALLPALIVALLAIVTVFVVLTIRQALIILLVVISPLAFVAYLLPNTESLFKKWRDLFKTLLLMYPIIAGIFGAAALASTVVMNSASSNNTIYKIAIQIMGALIAIVPLAITPIVMKAAGGLLGRIGGVVNNPNKGPFDRMRKGAEGYRDRRQNERGADALTGNKVFGGGQFKRAYRRDLRKQASEDSLKSAKGQFGVTDTKASGYVQSSAQSQAQLNAVNSANNARLISNIANNPGLVSAGMGSAANDQHVKQALDAQQKKALADAIKDAEISANIPPGATDEMASRLEQAVKNNDTITAQAMQNMLLRSGGPGIKDYRNAVNRLEGTTTATGENAMDSSAMTDMRQNMLQNHGALKASAADIVKHASTGGNLSAVSNDAATWKLSDAELVKQKSSSIEFALNSGAVSDVQAARIRDNPELIQHLEPGVRSTIQTLSSHIPPPP